MNKEEYWLALTTKNPSFKGDTVTISIRSLKAIVFQAHEKGAEMAQNANKTTQNGAKSKQNGYKSSDLDALRQIFGMK